MPEPPVLAAVADETACRIGGGERMSLWRPLDHKGEVLIVLVQKRRDRRAALRPLRKLLRNQGCPSKVFVAIRLAS
jgi:putative transposase